MHTLLDSLSLDYIDTIQVDEEAARFILKLLTHCAPVSYACKGNLNPEQRRKLKRLAIFPVMQTELLRAPVTVWDQIPDGKHIRSVFSMSLRTLPTVTNIVFLDGSIVDYPLFKMLEPDFSGPLSERDILLMALHNFASQSMDTQICFLSDMIENQDRLSRDIFKTLGQTSFVTATDGSLQSPAHIIGPESDIACLFSAEDNRLPRVESQQEKILVSKLQSTGVLQKTLTAEVVLERISFISSTPNTSDLARQLLKLLHRSGFDCTGLRIGPKLQWLPAQGNLLSPERCRDGDSHQKELFDEVLPLLDPDLKISPSLRMALCWDQPLPVRVLAEQLSKAVNLEREEAYRKVETVVKELVRRLDDLSDDELHQLRGFMRNRCWVPVSGGKLTDTLHAVFINASPSVGFYEIPFVQANQREFLLRMGCSERFGSYLY
jgi:sacsin